MVVSFCGVLTRERPIVGDRKIPASQRPSSSSSMARFNIRAIATSEIKLSLLIDVEYDELAVQTPTSPYNLDKG
jgi:aspartokinase